MKKEFVPYIESMNLKELGFNELCFAKYNSNNKLISIQWNKNWCENIKDNEIYAPTFSQVFKWFRRNHRLYSEITLDSFKEPYSLKVTIKHLNDTYEYVDKEYPPYSNDIGNIDNRKYEEAELVCLRKLIEILKNKNNES